MATSLMILIGGLALMAAGTMAGAPSEPELMTELAKIHEKLRVADHRLLQLSRRDCQAGVGGGATLCPFYGVSYYDIIKCLFSTLKGTEIVEVVEVEFEHPFQTTPNVAVFTSGFIWTIGGGYTVKVIDVTPKNMKVEVSASTPSIGSVHFNYIACDKDIDFPRTYLDKE